MFILDEFNYGKWHHEFQYKKHKTIIYEISTNKLKWTVALTAFTDETIKSLPGGVKTLDGSLIL